MTLAELKATLTSPTPPAGLSSPLLAMWHDGRGDWDAAHRVAQDIDDADGSWIHAYLHRKEGDTWNADYWYRKATKERPSCSLSEEWEEIARQLI